MIATTASRLPRRRRSIRGPLWVSLLALWTGCSALAQTAPALELRSLAATCASCHGTDGRAVPGSAIPPLAGLSADYFASQMHAFQDGTRAATVMQQIAKGFSKEQVAALAAYFAAQNK